MRHTRETRVVIANMSGTELIDLHEQNERLRANLERRDAFIVSKGLWMEFVESLRDVEQDGKEMAETIVTLHADGIRDDSEYFQARIDGRILGRADGKPDDSAPGDYRALVAEQNRRE